ncbi:N-methyl-D-aspartate receptor NMDAR2C subunit [Ramlibacter henchirensis]|uniref:N-methyl-D-aspartate receptor NMDAR2C subunit n=1 Tax=Ramlibacter henchirensis TaxID=204072 RepID=A0A4Z0BVC7_9BURK|nr:N-methyl-D-aspartate receptor NMDAR2C subunit [Ramlibacter henchirensis]TFZ02320.1 N-methyl-D-aspartate receptor NMDAR2C subunit [Ramlibacter henchirensis]
MNLTLAGWQRLWGELGAATANGGLMNQLVAAWGENHRRYHTLQHLRECLAHFEAASMLARRPAEVELAIWFHDAVYDPSRDDNEERSADWARASVRAAGCDAAIDDRVHALVMATRSHTAAVDDPDTRLLVDIDLAILGAAPARFDEYERQVRMEYAHVVDADWRTGRARVLRSFLDRPRIYATDAFRDALEARARENLARSLERLTGTSPP